VIEQRQAEQFLSELQARGKATWLRHVYIPGLNDNDDSIRRLCELRKTFSCVQRIELLPFRRLCLEKYQSMGIDFPLANTPEPTPEHIAALRSRFPALDG
jgi:pyruvate formate lyase activating enzyme